MKKEDKSLIKIQVYLELIGSIIFIIVGITVSKLFLSGFDTEIESQGLIILILMIIGLFTITMIGIKRLIGAIKILKKLNNITCTEQEVEVIYNQIQNEEQKNTKIFQFVFLSGMLIAFLIFIIKEIKNSPENSMFTIIITLPFILPLIVILYNSIKNKNKM